MDGCPRRPWTSYDPTGSLNVSTWCSSEGGSGCPGRLCGKGRLRDWRRIRGWSDSWIVCLWNVDWGVGSVGFSRLFGFSGRPFRFL